MRRSLLIAAALLVAGAAVPAFADQSPTVHGPPNAAERAFVTKMQADLGRRFGTAAQAERAGYVRYTGVDETGAISYANFHWQSADAAHPSQLWYDTSGRLLGADFSRLNAGDGRPNVWGIAPGRWYEFDDHLHWVLRDHTTGKMTYDKYLEATKYKAAGGDPAHPSADMLVKLGKIKDRRDVATLFDFPSLYDLIVWVVPNPSGAFAEKNPAVPAPKK